MSIVALAEAVRDHLQTVLSVDESECDIGFDGQPTPSSGEKFFAVHSLGWQGPNGDYDLSEDYTLAVTITRRLGYSPEDRWGVEIWAKATTGLDALVRQVITAIHHNQAIRLAANAKLDGDREFVTPLQFMRAEQPRLQGPGWFWMDPDDGSPHAMSQMGVSQTVVFGKCLRCQAIDEME